MKDPNVSPAFFRLTALIMLLYLLQMYASPLGCPRCNQGSPFQQAFYECDVRNLAATPHIGGWDMVVFWWFFNVCRLWTSKTGFPSAFVVVLVLTSGSQSGTAQWNVSKCFQILRAFQWDILRSYFHVDPFQNWGSFQIKNLHGTQKNEILQVLHVVGFCM